MKCEKPNSIESNVRIHFPENIVEGAHILMALSLFRSFRDQGLLTEEEFRCISSDAEKRWNNLMDGDSMDTNKVVFKE